MKNNSDYGSARWGELVNRGLGWSLVLICLGVSLHALDALIVATMMPAIVAEIGGANLVFWTISLYELGSVIASATCGLITLRYDLRVPMFIATLLFASGCTLSAIAPDMWVVLIGRLLQGLGGGGLLALSFVASAVLFPRKLLARAMGAISVFWGVSAFSGPLLGGIFVEFATWRIGFMTFAIIAVLLSLGILIKIRYTVDSASSWSQTRFPVWRLVWLSAGIIAIGYAGVDVSFTTSPVFVVFGIFCIVMFLRLDALKNQNRLLPSKPISLRHPIGSAFTMIICFSSASIALSIYGALIITSLYGVSILTAGYIIATPALGWSIASALISGLSERHDHKMIGIGMSLAALGIFGFAYSVPYGSAWLTASFGFVEGAGFGLAWTFISRRVCAVVPSNEIERATSAIPTAQAIGYAIGASYIGIVANASGFAAHLDGATMRFTAAVIFLSCTPLALVGLVATYKFVATKSTQTI